MRGLAARLTTLPAWVTILVIFAASRVFSSAILGVVFQLATSNGWAFASSRDNADFFTFSGSWDGSAYKQISEHGYPASLPRDGDGQVAANPWAFLPVYPALVHGIVAITGFAYYPVAVALATIFGFFACLALYAVVVQRSTPLAARWSVILFAFGPLGFMLQVAYAESLFLALTFAALAAVLRHRYLIVIPLGVLAAFTRPGVLALALTLAVHLLVRWRRPGSDPLTAAAAAKIVVAGLTIAAAGLAWPVIASAITGEPDAYLQTELAFWAPLIGHQDRFVPLTPWFLMAGRYLGPLGAVLVVALVAGFGLLVWRARRLGPDIVAWSASYGLYLFAVFLPQQSILRLLMPLAPLLGESSLTRTRVRRVTLLAVGSVAQVAAVVGLWFLSFP